MDTEEKSRRMYQLVSSQLLRDGYVDAANYVANATNTILMPSNPQDSTLFDLVDFAQEKALQDGTSLDKTSEHPQYTVENFVALGSVLSSKTHPNFKEVSTFSHRSAVPCLAQSPDGDLVASATENGDVCIHACHQHTRYRTPMASSKVKPFRYYSDSERPIVTMEFHPREAFLYAGGDDFTIKTYAYDRDDIAGPSNSFIDSAPITSLSCHPTGSLLLYSTQKSQLRFYDFEKNAILTSKIIETYASPNTISDIHFHPFGTSFSYISDKTQIVVHDGTTTKEAFRVTATDGEATINNLEYSKSGNILITSSTDGAVSLWDLRKFCTVLKRIPVGLSNIPSFAKFLWKEDIVVCNNDTALKGFDVHNGGSVFTIEHPSNVPTFATSPLRDAIVSIGVDLQMRFFEAK